DRPDSNFVSLMESGRYHSGRRTMVVMFFEKIGVCVLGVPTMTRSSKTGRPLSVNTIEKAGTLTKIWVAPSERGIHRHSSMLAITAVTLSETWPDSAARVDDPTIPSPRNDIDC